jgi:esterase/lipase superfamily enzyme
VSEAELDPVSQRLFRRLETYYSSGNYIAAADYAERYLALVERSVGRNHSRFTEALAWLAVTYRLQSRYILAELLSREALRLDEAKFGSSDIRLRPHIDNLAHIYQSQLRFGEAEELRKRDLSLVERVEGPNHQSMGVALNNLAWLYQAQGRLYRAEPIANRALVILEKTLGPADPETARALDTLAKIYEGQGRMTDARTLYVRSLAIFEKELDPTHPEIATSRTSLGGLYKALGQLEDAERLLSAALKANEEIFGADHPNLVEVLRQLGDLKRLQGQCTESEEHFDRASQAADDTRDAHIPVYFGTDRARDPSSRTIAFGSERGKSLSFGQITVAVPNAPSAGPYAQHRPAKAKERTAAVTETKRLAMHCAEEMDRPAFLDNAKGQVDSETDDALVFVHGYNTTFDSSIRRAAQIAHDTKFSGPVLVFSWPSKGRYFDYLTDRDAVDVAAANLGKLLKDIAQEIRPRKTHFVAHSMGNLVLLRALDENSRAPTEQRLAIGEVIHAAPDVDPDLFVDLSSKNAALGRTLYASRSDRALWFSTWMRDRPRAGYIRDHPLIVKGVDTIDITEAGMELFATNHDVYSSSPVIVSDIGSILRTGRRPPHLRTTELEEAAVSSGIHWRLRSASP